MEISISPKVDFHISWGVINFFGRITVRIIDDFCKKTRGNRDMWIKCGKILRKK